MILDETDHAPCAGVEGFGSTLVVAGAKLTQGADFYCPIAKV
jgi:hypothetical protein